MQKTQLIDLVTYCLCVSYTFFALDRVVIDSKNTVVEISVQLMTFS